jgi:hypothetical protein
VNTDEGSGSAGRALGDDTRPLPALRRWLQRPWAPAVLLLAIHAVLVWLAREPGILTGQGDVQYIVLGQSLRDGGYHDLFRADRPAHAQYPPGYPALIAAWGAVFGDSFDALAILSLLLSLTSLFLIFVAARRAFDQRLALWSLLVLSVNPVLIVFGGAIASEMPYLCTTAIALYAVTRNPVSSRWLAVALVAAIVAALTRSVGVTLLGALAMHWVLEERWRPALALAVTATLLFGGWLLWTVLSPANTIGGPYLSELRSAAGSQPWRLPLHERILDHAIWYARSTIPSSLAVPTIRGTWIDNLLTVSLLLICITAGLIALVRAWRPVAFYLLGYGALLAIWPWAVDRFVAPVVPLLVIAALAGVNTLAKRLRPTAAPMAMAVFAGVLAVSGTAHSLAAVRDHVRCGRGQEMPDPACLSADQASYFEALRWIGTNTPEQAVFLTAKSGALYRYTGRTSVDWDEGTGQTPGEFLSWLRQQRARWILASGLDVREPSALTPLLIANCRGLVAAAAFAPRTFLFELRDRVTDAEADSACAAAERYRALHPLRDEQNLR